MYALALVIPITTSINSYFGYEKKSASSFLRIINHKHTVNFNVNTNSILCFAWNPWVQYLASELDFLILSRNWRVHHFLVFFRYFFYTKPCCIFQSFIESFSPEVLLSFKISGFISFLIIDSNMKKIIIFFHLDNKFINRRLINLITIWVLMPILRFQLYIKHNLLWIIPDQL